METVLNLVLVRFAVVAAAVVVVVVVLFAVALAAKRRGTQLPMQRLAEPAARAIEVHLSQLSSRRRISPSWRVGVVTAALGAVASWLRTYERTSTIRRGE